MGNNLFSQNVVLINQSTNSPIAEVSLSSGKNGVISNVDGIAFLTDFNNTDLIRIQHVGYHKLELKKSNRGFDYSYSYSIYAQNSNIQGNQESSFI